MTKKITFNKLLIVGQFDYSRCFYMVDLNKGYQHKTQTNLDHNQAFEECSKNIEETSASNKNLGETSLNDNVVNDENTATKEDGEILEEDETIEEHLEDRNHPEQGRIWHNHVRNPKEVTEGHFHIVNV